MHVYTPFVLSKYWNSLWSPEYRSFIRLWNTFHKKGSSTCFQIRGDRGPFALYSLLCRHAKVGLLPNDRSVTEVTSYDVGSPCRSKFESRARGAIQNHKSSHYLMLFLALFSSCMMIGDGVLTPAISDVTVPFACAILVSLFTLQHYGTHKIGFIFTPVIILWLFFNGGVGFYNILVCNPHIFYAISPTYIYRFVRKIDNDSWSCFGRIVLCVAGSETMFADLGHFSKKSIKLTFITLIYPILILCYAGQAAFISKHLNSYAEFNHLSTSVPRSVRHIFIAFSLIASAVGSQATITASFSIINQCLALGCFPRVKVIHKSDKKHGQVYIPDVNWLLMILRLTVTISFHQVTQIGNAAGLAIISGMLMTTCLMSLLIVLDWQWSLFISACFLISFGFIQFMYPSACMLNFHRGAWFLVLLSAVTLMIMLHGITEPRKKYKFDFENRVFTQWLTDLSPGLGVSRLPGIGFIYTDIVTGFPAFFSHFITNLPAFHQVLIFVSFKSLPVPYVPSSRCYLIGRVSAEEYKIYRCIVRHDNCDPIWDTDDFEDQILKSIGIFISLEENDSESLKSAEGRMIVIGKPLLDENALIHLDESYSNDDEHTNKDSQTRPLADSFERDSVPAKRKNVRFTLPADSPQMQVSVRAELQELIDARESGTAYFLGQLHLAMHNDSSFLKRLLVMMYVFLDKNCREPPGGIEHSSCCSCSGWHGLYYMIYKALINLVYNECK